MNKHYNFHDRWNKLIKLDNIRLLKFLEIFQDCFAYMIILIIPIHLLNKYYFPNFIIKKREKSILNFFRLTIIVILETFMMTLILYYIQKIVNLIPSFSYLFDKNFIPYTTSKYTVSIAIIYVYAFSKNFKERYELLINYFE